MAAAAPNDDSMSSPTRFIASISRTKHSIQIAMKPLTDSTTLSDTRLPPIFTTNCAFGCTSCLISRYPCRSTITTRATFSPPTVEPEQPPTNARPTMISGAGPVHSLKPGTANPVVVIADTTWNAARRNAPTTVP